MWNRKEAEGVQDGYYEQCFEMLVFLCHNDK